MFGMKKFKKETGKAITGKEFKSAFNELRTMKAPKKLNKKPMAISAKLGVKMGAIQGMKPKKPSKRMGTSTGYMIIR